MVLAAFLLTACASATPEPPSTPVPVELSITLPESTPIPTPSFIPTPLQQRPSLLRIAILGEATTTNVWAIFDEAGADYWNLTTQASYWPSLYHLAPPSLNLQPVATIGTPPPVICDAFTCTATVSLAPTLNWTDGSPLTAEDVVFTVNTALQFRLGLNWHQAYNPDVLDHAEMVNGTTVEYYFKTEPSVADWQYGALLGPIVNRAYWQPRIARAVTLLPDDALLPAILELEGELAQMQSNVDRLNQSLYTTDPSSVAYVETTRMIRDLQDELNSIYNKLHKNRSEYELKLSEARAALFELANANEPTLGPWEFASRLENEFENQANPNSPVDDPRFDRVRYITYPNEPAAVEALQSADVDILLLPEGLSPGAVPQLANDPGISLSRNTTRSARFLAFNHANPYLADPVLHQALACLIDPQALVADMDGEAVPLPGFVLDEFWQNKDTSLPCSGLPEEARLAEAVWLLKSGGYTWVHEPDTNVEGVGLKSPGEFEIPPLTLLTPAQDRLREIAANYIAQQSQVLGLTVNVQSRDADDLLYSVYGSRDYDMALLGWRLSVYPSYLCDWFIAGGQNPFVYSGSRPTPGGDAGLRLLCEAWAQVNDIQLAMDTASQVQSILMSDLPLIPLYTEVRVDAYRNVQYPFSEAVDGLGDLYGAPALAIPIP